MAVVVRLRSRDGMFRCSVPSSSTDIASLWKMASVTLKRPVDSFFIKSELGSFLPSTGISLMQAGIKHGDIVSVEYPSTLENIQNDEETTSPATATPIKPAFNLVDMDPVDTYLEAQPGLIERYRDPKFCRHGDKGMCEYCCPLEPYDTSYTQDNKIKHLSFHSYIRKLLGRSSINKKTHASSGPMIHPLTPVSYRIPLNCTGGHAPWPAGICSKCQPGTISLQLQPYRMVDHVEVESPELIDRFLYFWRGTGYQRFAYLFGKYMPYEKVPLGMKAVICALYEPPQSNATDGLELTYLPGTEPMHEQGVEAKAEFEAAMEVARQCGLVLVGMAFTDLEDDQSGTSKVSFKRHEHSFFLSGLEVQLSAYMQKRFPCSTLYSATGEYGSRFVTVVVSGNLEGGIELEAYMVSETAVAMLDAELFEPSTAPSLLLVSENAPYVPDILYTEKNEYGIQVSKSAAPSFPCDYFLVNLTHGFPSQPNPQFQNTYPIENRFSEPQSFISLHAFLHPCPPHKPDFHFLLHLYRTHLLLATDFLHLCSSASWSEFDFSKLDVFFQNEQPQRASSPKDVSMEDQFWSCEHCTYHNSTTAVDCEMCGLPK